MQPSKSNLSSTRSLCSLDLSLNSKSMTRKQSPLSGTGRHVELTITLVLMCVTACFQSPPQRTQLRLRVGGRGRDQEFNRTLCRLTVEMRRGCVDERRKPHAQDRWNHCFPLTRFNSTLQYRICVPIIMPPVFCFVNKGLHGVKCRRDQSSRQTRKKGITVGASPNYPPLNLQDI